MATPRWPEIASSRDDARPIPSAIDTDDHFSTSMHSGLAPPREPVAVGGRCHRLGCAAEPLARTPIKIGENPRPATTNMHVSDFPAHGAQKVLFITPARQVADLDARAVRRQPSHDPAVAYGEKRIGGPHRGRKQPYGITGAHAPRSGKGSRRWNCNLGFAGDLRAVPIGNRDEPRSPEAADPGD